MSAPRGFITLTRVENKPLRMSVNAIGSYGHYRRNGELGEGTRVFTVGDPDPVIVSDTPEQIDALIAAAQGDAPTTPEPLPPLVEDARQRIARETLTSAWPDMVSALFPTEEARALLAWLDRGRP